VSDMSYNSRVLVMTLADGLAWQVVRSLFFSGVKPYVIGQLPGSVLSRVSECAGYFCFRDIKRDNRGILDVSNMDQVIRLAEELKVDTIMAADLSANWMLSQWVAKGDSNRIAVATPTPDLIINLHDKWKLTKILSDLNLPYPESELAENEEEVLNTKLAFPIITKPLDMASSTGVQLHHSREELIATVEDGRLFKSMPLLVQRYIPGEDIGFSFFADNGKILASALCRQMCRGVRQYFSDNRMNQLIEKLLLSTGYTGVGHIDARYDPDVDEYRILEVNPRFWASVLYATRAGLNFPSYLLRHKYGESLPRPVLKTAPINMSFYERVVAWGVRGVEMHYFARGIVS
jgi:biotin carboxylase